MAQNFLPCDREQELLLPPSLREWLAEDHLAWFVIDAVAELDHEGFYAAYRRDGWGAAAHDPQMMVALLVYAYAIGERSSRAIESRCREDVAFRVITANQVPDHATVARFRVRHEAALGDLFGQILGLCADAGLVSVGVVAVDGSKFAASASDRAVRSYEQIAAESWTRRTASTRPRMSSTVPPAATSYPSIWPSARDGGPGCAGQSSASSANAPSAPSRSRTREPSGSGSASAGSSRTGRRSGLRTANTRPAGSAVCSSAGASRWARAPGPTPRRQVPRGSSTQQTRTRGG